MEISFKNSYNYYFRRKLVSWYMGKDISNNVIYQMLILEKEKSYGMFQDYILYITIKKNNYIKLPLILKLMKIN